MLMNDVKFGNLGFEKQYNTMSSIVSHRTLHEAPKA
jgi:hypothetical protein